MDSDFLRCWLHQYSRSPFYPNSTARAANKTLFLQGLKRYLQVDWLSLNDIMFDDDVAPQTILASRCYLLSVNEVSIFIQSELMIRMRNLVRNVRDFPMFVFQPVFVMLEHTIAILPSTLQVRNVAFLLSTSVPMCTSPTVSQSHPVPVPPCRNPILYQSHPVAIPFCTSPTMSQSHPVSVPSSRSVRFIVSQSRLVRVPPCRRPILYQSHRLAVPSRTSPTIF